MSDELEPNTEPVEPDVVEAEPQGDVETTDWKAEARKWEKRAKEANAFRDDASRWREYEASLKPEQERLAEELQTVRMEAESARTALMRYEIASEKGIPAEAISLLQGSSREELEEAADSLLKLIANQSKPKPPLPDELQGKPASGAPGQITDRNVLKSMTAQEIMEAKATGRLDQLIGK